ncbi:MAG: thiol peroxidase [Methylophilaceae bacterium]|jgi:thioredoxin-dependent peroxiredoxin|nr:thiol peroxidase [Methylophilaceae bacterium]
MSQVMLKGGPVSVGGSFPQVGDNAKDFSLADNKREDINLESFKGKKKVINIFPSIDTPTCALSVKRFNDEVSHLSNTVVLCVSADLPFAQKRFCGAEGTDKVITLSSFRNNEKFSNDYGVSILDTSLKGLTSRAVIVLDENNKVIHSELVAEITEEPNYEAALSVLK